MSLGLGGRGGGRNAFRRYRASSRDRASRLTYDRPKGIITPYWQCREVPAGQGWFLKLRAMGWAIWLAKGCLKLIDRTPFSLKLEPHNSRCALEL